MKAVIRRAKHTISAPRPSISPISGLKYPSIELRKIRRSTDLETPELSKDSSGWTAATLASILIDMTPNLKLSRNHHPSEFHFLLLNLAHIYINVSVAFYNLYLLLRLPKNHHSTLLPFFFLSLALPFVRSMTTVCFVPGLEFSFFVLTPLFCSARSLHSRLT